MYKNKGNTNDPDNYRGIIILTCMGKPFTTLLNNRLTKFLDSYNVICEEQAGFRRQYCWPYLFTKVAYGLLFVKWQNTVLCFHRLQKKRLTVWIE